MVAVQLLEAVLEKRLVTGRGPVFSPGSMEPEREAGPAAMPPLYGEAGMGFTK